MVLPLLLLLLLLLFTSQLQLRYLTADAARRCGCCHATPAIASVRNVPRSYNSRHIPRDVTRHEATRRDATRRAAISLDAKRTRPAKSDAIDARARRLPFGTAVASSVGDRKIKFLLPEKKGSARSRGGGAPPSDVWTRRRC